MFFVYVVGLHHHSFTSFSAQPVGKTKLNFIILSNDPVSRQPENGYCCGCREREENVFVIYVLCLKKDDFAQCSLGRVISQCISYH